ncbi:12029_t:CDS:2, partial [Ambispora leptoticha]
YDDNDNTVTSKTSQKQASNHIKKGWSVETLKLDVLEQRKRTKEREPKQLRDWITKKSDLMKAAPYIQKLSHGARLRYPELEAELIEWFRDLRSQQKV